MKIHGKHLIADFYRCRTGMTATEAVQPVICQAVEQAGATLLNLHVHPFAGGGFTAAAVLSESHLTVHTWPESDYVALDLFTCGDTVDPEAGLRVLEAFFQPEEVSLHLQERGELLERERLVCVPECMPERDSR